MGRASISGSKCTWLQPSTGGKWKVECLIGFQVPAVDRHAGGERSRGAAAGHREERSFFGAARPPPLAGQPSRLPVSQPRSRLWSASAGSPQSVKEM